MGSPVKIGIIICDRYHTCAGGKYFRSFMKREGAFKRYKGKDVGMADILLVSGNWDNPRIKKNKN